MQNIVIFYGGKSVEHDISVLTAISAMKNMDKSKYNIIPIYITRQNKFIVPSNYLNVKNYAGEIKKFKQVEFVFGSNKIKVGRFKQIEVSCAINCCHGFFGEDGTISAICNLCNIPLTATDILGASTCMDKVIMKDIFVANNIPCVKYLLVTKLDYSLNSQNVLKQITNTLEYPIIVKPSNLGSSIGITKANNQDELCDAIQIAFCYDDRVIVENCLQNFKEINIACLGDEICEVSSLEQPAGWQDFLNFDDKYLDTSIRAKKILNPKLKAKVKEQIKNLAKKCFKVFNLSGVVRIDFMVEGDNVYVNEINTVPGSLAFYLWQQKYDYFELIDKLIELAKQKYKNKNLHKYTYSSNILADYKENNINKYSK